MKFRDFIQANQPVPDNSTENFQESDEPIQSTSHILSEGIHDKGIFKAVFLGGGPGSGKDYVLDNTLDGHGLVEINSDKALEYLMDKENLDKTMPDNEEAQRNVVRKRAKNIAELRQRLAINGRNGLIINGTGDDPEKYLKIKKMLETLGYDTHMLMVNTADDISKQRNIERGQRGGRTVPENIRKQKWDDVQAARPKFAKIFRDNYIEFDNSHDLRDDSPTDPRIKEQKQQEILDIFKHIQKFVAQPPKADHAKSWIATQLGQKDTAPIRKDVQPHPDAGTHEDMMKNGLEYYGFGRYGKNGKVTHRSVHGKLVPMEKINKTVETHRNKINKDKTVKTRTQGNRHDRKRTTKKNINESFQEYLAEQVTFSITGDTPKEIEELLRLLRNEVPEDQVEEEKEGYAFSDNSALTLLTLGKGMIKEDLRNWFNPSHPEGGWKRINSKGEAVGPCAREPGEPKPKCMSNEKRASLSKKERASAVAAKRKHDPVADRSGKGGKPVNVSNYGKGKISEESKPKQKLLSDRNGKPRVFHIRGTAAKEAHQKNGTVVKVGNKYVVKIREDVNEVYTSDNSTIEILYGQNSSTPSAKELGKVRADFGRKAKPSPDKPVNEHCGGVEGHPEATPRKTIKLSDITQKKIKESIDKGIEPGISMAGAGESPARDMGEKIRKRSGKASQVIEMTGDETGASIGDQKEDELKKKGISLTTFKKRNYI